MEKKTVAVTGMMCGGCASNVERRLKDMKGVKSASVNLSSGTALIEFDRRIVTLHDMRDELSKIGYDMVIDNEEEVVEIERRAHRLLVSRTALSWLFAVLTMAVCTGWLNVGDTDAANQVMLVAALLNIVYCRRSFYVNAWKQLRSSVTLERADGRLKIAFRSSFTMDTLVALSTGISFLFSTFNTFFGESYRGGMGMGHHTYFDASVMIITFVLTGRLIEQRAKNGTASAIKALMGLSPKTARVLVGDKAGRGGRFEEKPIGDVHPGDVVMVSAGEKIPVDGSVSKASTGENAWFTIDESMITGEPVAVTKKAGEKVYAGTIVREGTLVFDAEEVGSKTVLADIIRTVREAQGSKAPVQRIADRIAAVFVPAVLLLSVLTFVLWMTIGGVDCLPTALLSAISVLVIACPCALGLATPTALTVGIGKAAQRNILIKDAVALENMRNINALVIDKTGTLTTPAGEKPREKGGAGVTNAVSTRLPEERETLKPHAAEAVRQLKHIGIDVFMMSGDHEEAVSYWADKVGIDHWQSGVLPRDKEEKVRRLREEGRRVAMVGDGINDAQALAAADISIAMGKGTDIAMDVAQVTLMGDDLRRIPEAVMLSRKTVAAIRQNLFWAFVYNVVCIPLAAGLPFVFGFSWHITPMWAGALMAFSSISVVLNSLRLKLVL